MPGSGRARLAAWRRTASAVFGGCALAAAPALALEASGQLILAPEFRHANAGSPYAVAVRETPTRSLRQDWALKLREGGFNADARLRFDAAEQALPERHGIVNQAYYDGALGDGEAFTIGRKVLSWGVGFGFRPLDVVQREDRRGFNPAPLVGRPLLAWERYSAAAAWSAVLVHPLADSPAQEAQAPALALRWYRLAPNGDDWHAVARLSSRQQAEVGGGLARTLDDAWAVHAAVLYQRRVASPRNTLLDSGATLAALDPMADALRRHGLSAVAGVQWTGASGLGLLAEAWHDAAAYRRDDWRQLDALTGRQRALAGVVPQAAIDGNLAWSAAAFARSNLLRDNLLLRLSYEEDQRWKLALEWLATPADGGRVLTGSVAWQGDRQSFALGLRQLGGAPDSAYALAPTRAMAYLQWSLALP